MPSNNLKIYSKGRSKRRSSRAYARNHSLAWVWLLVGMLLGLLGALLFYTQILTTQKGIAGGAAGVSGSKTTMAHAKKAPPKQYEFYSILPGMEVVLPDEASETGEAHDQPNLQKNPPGIIESRLPKVETRKEISQLKEIVAQKESVQLKKSQPERRRVYIVQTGVFRDAKEADMLKSTLSLQGFETKIQKIKAQDGQIWYRVAFGPYASETEARSMKKTLKANHIHGILILQRQLDQ